MLELDVAGAVQQAAAGEAAGWDFLVEHYSGMVWSVARGHGLSAADSADVSQTTWLRLAEHLGRLRQPERVGGWLATTARHEAKRVVRRGQRLATVAPTGLETLRVHRFLPGQDRESPPPDRELEALEDAEEGEALWRALEKLPVACRSLLRMLMADPPPTYEEVSEALDMPVGSIGPQRARCLARLRSMRFVRPAHDAGTPKRSWG